MKRVNKDGTYFVGVTVTKDLFEKIEQVRTTERGRIPRNEFIRTAITKLIEETEAYMKSGGY